MYHQTIPGERGGRGREGKGRKGERREGDKNPNNSITS